MTPEAIQNNPLLQDSIALSPDATPEDLKKAVEASVARVEEAIAAGGLAYTQVSSPYRDRLFKADGNCADGRKREILLYPNPKLEQESTNIEYFGSGVMQLAADLVATATATNAAGLSAIQIGVNANVVAVRIDEGFVVMVNPRICVVDHSAVEVEEGCLSFPSVLEKVDAYKEIEVHYQDLQGLAQTMSLVVNDASGSACQAVQHECEHLNGVLLISKLSSVHRDRVRTHMKKVGRRLAEISRKSQGKVCAMQALFGYIPDPEVKVVDANFEVKSDSVTTDFNGYNTPAV